jgi:hypothetical protein
MAELNPINNEFAITIRELQKRVNAFETVRQQYINDWTDLNPAHFIYGGQETITVTGYDATEILQVGDKLRVKQTSYKYFTVYAITTTTITINTTPSYSLANATISEIAYSRLENPQGWTSDGWDYLPVSQYGSLIHNSVYQQAACTISSSITTRHPAGQRVKFRINPYSTNYYGFIMRDYTNTEIVISGGEVPTGTNTITILGIATGNTPWDFDTGSTGTPTPTLYSQAGITFSNFTGSYTYTIIEEYVYFTGTFGVQATTSGPNLSTIIVSPPTLYSFSASYSITGEIDITGGTTEMFPASINISNLSPYTATQLQVSRMDGGIFDTGGVNYNNFVIGGFYRYRS